MALVTTKEMFEKAFQGGYAIGAFNITIWKSYRALWLPQKHRTPQLSCRYLKVR